MFDHVTLASFFVALGIFILGLCVGNALMLRDEYRPAAALLAMGAVAAPVASDLVPTLALCPRRRVRG